MRARAFASFVLTAIVAMGCGDEPQRPPIIWEGENLRFGTDADTEICAGTFPYLDGVAGHLADVFEQPRATIDYYWLPDGVEAFCGDDLRGCVPTEAEAFSTLAIHQHELVHAVRWPQGLYLPLEEGLAVAYGDDWTPMAPVSGDITSVLEHEHGELPWEQFPLAGHFVSYLRAVHGVEPLLELDAVSDYLDSLAKTEDAFRDVYGVELADEVERYEADYPRCDERFYRDTTFDCSRNLVAAPDALDEEIHVTVSLACDDPAVLGPRFDQRWTTVTLDVQTPGLYFVYAGKVNDTYTRPIRLQECYISCFEAPDAVLFDSQIIGGRLCLDRTRYLFRFADDVDFSDYEIVVRMVSPSCN